MHNFILEKPQKIYFCNSFFFLKLDLKSEPGESISHFWGIPNNVLLVKIEGPVWYTIYHHLPVKGVNLQTPLFSSTNQWEKDIYGWL